MQLRYGTINGHDLNNFFMYNFEMIQLSCQFCLFEILKNEGKGVHRHSIYIPQVRSIARLNANSWTHTLPLRVVTFFAKLFRNHCLLTTFIQLYRLQLFYFSLHFILSSVIIHSIFQLKLPFSILQDNFDFFSLSLFII